MHIAPEIQILRAVRDWNLNRANEDFRPLDDRRHYQSNAGKLHRRIAALRNGGAS